MNTRDLLEKARGAADSARILSEAGDADGACNRGYYAMFDAARGLAGGRFWGSRDSACT